MRDEFKVHAAHLLSARTSLPEMIVAAAVVVNVVVVGHKLTLRALAFELELEN